MKNKLVAIAVILIFSSCSHKNIKPKFTVKNALDGLKNNESIVFGRFFVEVTDPTNTFLFVIPRAAKQEENCELVMLHNDKLPNFDGANFKFALEELSPLPTKNFYIPKYPSENGLYYFKVPSGKVFIKSLSCGRIVSYGSQDYGYRYTAKPSNAFEIPLNISFTVPAKSKTIYLGDYFIQVKLDKGFGDKLSESLLGTMKEDYKLTAFKAVILSENNMTGTISDLKAGLKRTLPQSSNISERFINELNKREFLYPENNN